MSVTDGYRRDARDPGPQTVLRVAPVNDSQAALLRQQQLMTSDPARQQELQLLAALEQRYAQQAAQAQQGVQDATLNQNPLKKGDFLMGSPWQSAAKMQRGMLRDRAAAQYNAGLPAGYMGQRKSLGDQFYGG